MKARTIFSLSVVLFFMVALCLTSGCTQPADNSAALEAKQAAAEAKEAAMTAQKLAQKALDAREIQNVMSRHAYYHSVGLHYEELEDIWVSEDGEYADTASFKNMVGIWQGIPLIKVFYADVNLKNRKRDLEAVATVHPEVKDDPNYHLGGGSWNIHTQTTPVIEVAGDGKTAKGVWYSPGIMEAAVVKDGKVEVQGGWFWEKYGVDFVRENGQWKIWHIGMYYDNTPPAWGAAQEPVQETGEQVSTMTMVEPTRPNPEPYKGWTPTTTYDKIEPRLPEPYETFSETFSY